MGKVVRRFLFRAAVYAAISTLMCLSKFSWGQTVIPGPTPDGIVKGGVTENFGSVLAPKQADDVFDQYASLDRLAVA